MSDYIFEDDEKNYHELREIARKWLVPSSFFVIGILMFASGLLLYFVGSGGYVFFLALGVAILAAAAYIMYWLFYKVPKSVGWTIKVTKNQIMFSKGKQMKNFKLLKLFFIECRGTGDIKEPKIIVMAARIVSGLFTLFGGRGASWGGMQEMTASKKDPFDLKDYFDEMKFGFGKGGKVRILRPLGSNERDSEKIEAAFKEFGLKYTKTPVRFNSRSLYTIIR